MATVITFTAGPSGMTKRDFLASHGLAKAGTRGRFSTKAVEFLEQAIAAGVTFEEPVKAAPKVSKAEVKAADKPETVAEATASKWTAPTVSLQTIVRPQKTHYGLSPEGFIVGWDICSDCGMGVQYCTHDVPRGPKGVEFVTTDKSEVRV